MINNTQIQKYQKRAEDFKNAHKINHYFVVLIIFMNVLFDYNVYSLVQSKDVILVLCSFVNSWSARWVFGKYNIANRWYPLGYNLNGMVYVFIVISSISLLFFIYQFLSKFLINLF